MDEFLVQPDPIPPEELLVSADPKPSIPLPPEVVEGRAQKLNLALGETSPGQEQLRSDILIGHEQAHRESLATKERVKRRELKLQLLDDYAQTTGGAPDPETVNMFLNLDESADITPDTVLEQVVARKTLSGNLLAGTNSTISEGDPETVQATLDGGEAIMGKKEGAQRILEDLSARWSDQGLGNKVWDIGEIMVPFVQWNQISKVAGLDAESTLPGDQVEDLRQKFYDMPINEAIPWLKAKTEAMAERNLFGAMTLAQSILQYSSSDQLLDNALSILDVAEGAFVAVKGVKALTKGSKLAKKAPTPTQQAQKSIKDTVKAATNPKNGPEDVMAASGHIEEAATLRTINELRGVFSKRIKDFDQVRAEEKFMDSLPPIFNPSSWMGDSARALTRVQTQRIMSAIDETTPGFLRAMTEGLRIERLPQTDEMMAAMVDQAKELTKLQYPHLADTLLDPVPVLRQTPSGDFWEVGVRFGDDNASLFKSYRQAHQHAEMMGFQGHDIGQQGAGFFVQVNKPVDETAPRIRSLLVNTDNQTPTDALGNLFFAGIRTPEDTLSAATMADRKAATGGINALQFHVNESIKRIGSLGKRSWNNLKTFVDNDRTYSGVRMDAQGKTEAVEGRFAESLSEFETRWYDQTGIFPTEAETTAYLEYVRLNNLDYIFRNFRVLRDKHRKGIEVLDFPLGNDMLRNIEAKTVQKVDWDKEGGILILRENGTPQFVRTNEPGRTFGESPHQRAYVEKLQTEGYRIFQVTRFGDRDLKANKTIRGTPDADFADGVTGDEKIHYVLAKQYTIKPLSLQQLPYKPGGHRRYDNLHYVGQPSIKRLQRSDGTIHRYDGDKTIMGFSTESKARKYASILDEARKMLKSGVPDEVFDTYILNNFPKTPDQVRSLFNNKLDDQGKIVAEAQYSLDDVISSRPSGARFADRLNLKGEYENFRDSSDDALDLYQDMNQAYISARDPILETIDETQSTFKVVPARMVDAMSTLNRGMSDMFEARFVDDIKTKEIEKFIQEFGDTLQVDHPEALTRNPMKHIFEPVWNENVDRARLIAAQNSQRSLKQFIGTETKTAKTVRWIQQKLLDSVYNTFGDKGTEIVPAWLLGTVKDPIKYARGVAFHTKLGLFNPVQLFLQSQTFFHMGAIVGPKIAGKAGPAAALMNMLRFTDEPAVISKFSAWSKAYGMSPADFEEAYRGLRETGWDRIGGEVAMRDDQFESNLFPTMMGKFLNLSPVFFNAGERFVRTSAYTAAHLEWRGANPTAKLTNAEKIKILNRADLLAGNMTRASNASWQRGFASAPTQFFAYQFRIAEQLLGKRLGSTVAERAKMRARVLATYSVLYGVPVALGATTAVWPWSETLRQELIERGVKYDDNIVSRVLVDGVVSTAIQAASGEKYNVGQRYGPGGLTVLRDLWTGDKTGAEILMGVSGTVFMDMYKAADPLFGTVAEIVSGKNPDFTLTAEDMIDFTREISSANNALKTIYGLNYGSYITKNEINMGDISWDQALFMGVAGLQPQKIEDSFLKMNIMKELNAVQKEATKRAVKWLRRAVREHDNPDQFKAYMNRALLEIEGAGMDMRQRGEVFSQGLKGFESLTDKIDFDFAKTSKERMEDYAKEKEEKPE